jgi:hypothetical protein
LVVLETTCLAAGVLSTCAVAGRIYFLPCVLSIGLLIGFETAACSFFTDPEVGSTDVLPPKSSISSYSNSLRLLFHIMTTESLPDDVK